MITDTLQLSISGSDPVSSSASQAWIKLTLDPPERQNEITKKQLSEWLNSAYGITDPCRGIKSEDAYQPGDHTDSTQQRLQTALSGGSCYEAADYLAMRQQCNPFTRAGFSRQFNVYAHCSSEYIRERYKFRCSSDISPSGPHPAQSVIQVIIDFDDADYVPVYRYAEADEVRELWEKEQPVWLGDVLIGKARVDSDTIGVGWSNGRIVLSEPVSGRLVVSLPIQYDVWSVSVPGTIIAGKRDYTASAFAFEVSINEPALIELTDETEDPAEGTDCQLCDGVDDPLEPGDYIKGPTGELIVTGTTAGQDCQLAIPWEVRNWCTDELIDSGTRYEPTTCPDKVQPYTEITYTTASTPDSAKWSAAEYKEACCEEVNRETCLTCKKIYRTYEGTNQVLPSREYWQDRHPNNQVIFNFVPTEDGGPCGQRVDTFDSPNTTCYCPQNTYFQILFYDDQYKIYDNGALIHESAEFHPPDLPVNEIVNVSGRTGPFRIELYNNDSDSPWRLKYQFFLGGEGQGEIDEYYAEEDTAGKKYEKEYSCN